MAVTKEEVIWCCRMLLGREPESDAAINSKMRATDWQSLVRGFLASAEYKTKSQPAPIQRLPLNPPAERIDFDATPAQITQLLWKIRDAWSYLGAVEPHHSVLSSQIFRPKNTDASIDQFWGSGRSEAETITGQLRRYGFDGTQAKVCVEYGCGVGRVTVPLSGLFGLVHAYDISDNHLKLAQDHAQATGAENIRFHRCSESLPSSVEACDFFYSKIVFQHNPPPVIRELIRMALQSLNPGGLAIFQVPTHIKNYVFSIDDYLTTQERHGMEIHCLPQREIFALVAEQRCSVVEVREDGSVGRPDIRLSNTFVVTKAPLSRAKASRNSSRLSRRAKAHNPAQPSQAPTS